MSPVEPDPDDLLSIGEMSRRTGVAVSALRYYESLGLIVSVRTEGNQRRFARHMLRRVSLISVALVSGSNVVAPGGPPSIRSTTVPPPSISWPPRCELALSPIAWWPTWRP